MLEANVRRMRWLNEQTQRCRPDGRLQAHVIDKGVALWLSSSALVLARRAHSELLKCRVENEVDA